MGEANEGRSRGLIASLSLPIEEYPRDLLQRLTCNRNTQQSQNFASNDEEDSEELELNLGLSLGGRFGVEKNDKKKLIRSSSIAGTIPLFREEESTKMHPFSYPNLTRTSSLPTETEEWRKRKNLQTLRRMAAKRRRSEKQRNSAKAEKEGCSLAEEKREIEGRLGLNLSDIKQQYDVSNNTLNSIGVQSFGLPTWSVADRQSVLGDGTDLVAKGKSDGFLGFGQPSSQGSMESQGGSSSGISELESKPPLGSSGSAEAKSPASNHLLHDTINKDTTGSSGAKACATSRAKMENTSKSHRSGVEDMPCVFAKGDGPNGRKVDGILYRYGKGEEVRIMCICHGEFHTPAEFVKHAGGSDVTHPLRHIVVNPCSTSML